MMLITFQMMIAVAILGYLLNTMRIDYFDATFIIDFCFIRSLRSQNTHATSFLLAAASLPFHAIANFIIATFRPPLIACFYCLKKQPSKFPKNSHILSLNDEISLHLLYISVDIIELNFAIFAGMRLPLLMLQIFRHSGRHFLMLRHFHDTASPQFIRYIDLHSGS